MRFAITAIFVLVGLMNFLPVAGVVSGDRLATMYAVELGSTDLVVLMRHRAVMLGLIGGLMIVAAFRPALRLTAAIVGLLSMLAFVVLAHLPDAVNSQIHRVALADLVGSLAMVVALLLMVRTSPGGRDPY